jgi:hypothetical protein
VSIPKKSKKLFYVPYYVPYYVPCYVSSICDFVKAMGVHPKKYTHLDGDMSLLGGGGFVL